MLRLLHGIWRLAHASQWHSELTKVSTGLTLPALLGFAPAPGDPPTESLLYGNVAVRVSGCRSWRP